MPYFQPIDYSGLASLGKYFEDPLRVDRQMRELQLKEQEAAAQNQYRQMLAQQIQEQQAEKMAERQRQTQLKSGLSSYLQENAPLMQPRTANLGTVPDYSQALDPYGVAGPMQRDLTMQIPAQENMASLAGKYYLQAGEPDLGLKFMGQAQEQQKKAGTELGEIFSKWGDYKHKFGDAPANAYLNAMGRPDLIPVLSGSRLNADPINRVRIIELSDGNKIYLDLTTDKIISKSDIITPQEDKQPTSAFSLSYKALKDKGWTDDQIRVHLEKREERLKERPEREDTSLRQYQAYAAAMKRRGETPPTYDVWYDKNYRKANAFPVFDPNTMNDGDRGGKKDNKQPPKKDTVSMGGREYPVQAKKTVNGKSYVKVNGAWYEE